MLRVKVSSYKGKLVFAKTTKQKRVGKKSFVKMIFLFLLEAISCFTLYLFMLNLVQHSLSFIK